MKFGKEFKKQKVPEWIDAYMDYSGLKQILREIMLHKLSRQPPTPLRAIKQKLKLHRTFSGLHAKSRDFVSQGDIEDQVIDVEALPRDGSGHFYRTNFLRQSEGGEIEEMFFEKLDQELNKVNKFYKDKVEAVRSEAAELNKQMDALIALRIKVDTKNASPDNATAVPLRTSTRTLASDCTDLTIGVDTSNNYQEGELTGGPEVSEVTTANCSSDCKEEENKCEDHSLEILEHVKINNTLETPRSTLKGVFKDSKDDELRFRKEELRKVEGQLRVVFIEFYQKLRLLKNYSFMNLAAFSKIMKKYDKITSTRASRSYMKIVDNSYLGSSEDVTSLLEKVETTFISHFSNSNRKDGMKSLRPKGKKERHGVTFLSGFFSGCSIALLIAVVLRIEARDLMDKKEGASYLVNIFPLYRQPKTSLLFAYAILHMLMYAADIYFWRRYRVNYPFILGFKQGTVLSYREVFLLSTGLAVLALSSFLANLHLDMGSRTEHYRKLTELVPLFSITIVIVIIFCPFDIIYRSSRLFFIKSATHCFFAPLYKVTLPDFLLADNITSQVLLYTHTLDWEQLVKMPNFSYVMLLPLVLYQVQAIRSIELYICYYGLGESSQRQSKCHTHGIYNAFYFIVAIVPFWLRFLQCLRRLCEEKDAVHGWNGLKYLLIIIAVLIRTAFELKKGTTWFVLALASSAVAVAMSTYWDIVMDWGLLQRKSKNTYLRDNLVISNKSVYFAAMVLNIVLRVAWMQLVIEFNLHSLQKMAITTIISCLEVFRRGIWNFFRLENEHLNNVGKYRAFKSVPLPFSYNDEETEKDD
ncbi:phosphate transporter PHO1 homolog 10 isoform X5 [Citrus sinensis]|uniref:phosphate transporter PHO1 homolog 10 isoform X5 n=1 Tax=Citrus sinensis TaxID=2711 RepID=UPI0022799661|nr:phosphate transporter PHO1 homolog 10 isoform X5 [Citrus sinensis]